MPRSEKELAEALAQSEAWMDAVSPDEIPPDAVDDRKDLRQIGAALISIEAAEQALVSAVANARAKNRSWTDIANVLGVSRQAARQRFGGRVTQSDRDASVRREVGRLSGSERRFAEAIFDGGSTTDRLVALRQYIHVLNELLGALSPEELKEIADPVNAGKEEHRRG